MRPDPAVTFWDGETQGTRARRYADPLRRALRRRHRAALGAGRRREGALLSGDIVQVGPDRKVSFMRSYPDLIPLDAVSVQHIADVLAPWPFDPVYGAWWERIIASGGKQAMDYSVRRYLKAISAPPGGLSLARRGGGIRRDAAPPLDRPAAHQICQRYTKS